jgi:hypothetical protein
MRGPILNEEGGTSMSEKLKRREVAKAAAVAGGLLLLSGAASAQADRGSRLAGEWFNDGKVEQPCAIFVHGRVLLVVNEKGNLATARVTEAGRFLVLKGTAGRRGWSASWPTAAGRSPGRAAELGGGSKRTIP